MEEFPSNSQRAKRKVEERPKVERVVTGEVIRRKKPLGRRIAETFFGSADARGVTQYVVQDVIVPTTKDLITDVITQGLERALFGEVRGRGSAVRNRSSSSYTAYQRYSQPGSRQEDRRELSHRVRSRHDFDELVIPSLPEAQEVLDTLFGLIKEYGTATVADFYEAAGYSGQFVDENWGWTDLRDADVIRVRGGGYVVKLPPTERL